MGFTPGPWEIQPEFYDPKGYYEEPAIVVLDASGDIARRICTIRIGIEGSDANARLISAAPEMLAALKAQEEADRLLRAARMLNEEGSDLEPYAKAEAFEAKKHAVALREAALAKADGR